MEVLIKHGADTEAKNRWGLIALHLAAIRGHKAAVKMPIEHGADIEARNNEGQTAFDCAKQSGIVWSELIPDAMMLLKPRAK